jgi:hypothetical protein
MIPNNDEHAQSDIDLYSYPQRDSRCTACNSDLMIYSNISCILCNGKKSPDVNNVFSDITTNTSCEAYNQMVYMYCVRKFKVQSVIFNDIMIRDDIKIRDFIQEQFDFDFCKNYYTNDKLHILHPVAVLKNKCVYKIPYHLKSKSKIFTTLNRKLRYEQRGFNITVGLTPLRKQELILYATGKVCKNHEDYPNCGCYTAGEFKELDQIEVLN